MSGPVSDEAVCRMIGSALPPSAARGGVTPGMKLRSDLGVDSLALMGIVFVLEEQAGIDAFAHVQSFIEAESVADIIEIVRRG